MDGIIRELISGHGVIGELGGSYGSIVNLRRMYCVVIDLRRMNCVRRNLRGRDRIIGKYLVGSPAEPSPCKGSIRLKQSLHHRRLPGQQAPSRQSGRPECS